MVDSPRNEGKDYFEINTETGEVFTKIVFDREKQGAYALEVEARDGAPSARPNNGDAPNSGTSTLLLAHARYHNYIITQLSLFNKFCFESNVSNCHALFVVSKFIRIGIADKNDNPPYFDKALYEAEVDENEDIQHTVLTVTAKDHDEC